MARLEAASRPTDGRVSTYDLLADLPLEVEDYTLERARARRLQRLHPPVDRHPPRGGGHEGLGEDVTYDGVDHVASRTPGRPAAGRALHAWRTFCRPPRRRSTCSRPSRCATSRASTGAGRSSSAALDLALRQAGQPLHEVLGREPRPVTFVVSLRLGEPATLAPLAPAAGALPGAALQARPDRELDARADRASSPPPAPSTRSTSRALYRGTVVDNPADPVLYRRVAEAFPEAWIEDPDLDSPRPADALADAHDRITWDAPIHSVVDIEALPFPPQDGQRQALALRRRCASCSAPTTTAPSTASAPTAAASSSSGRGAGRSSTSRRCSIPTRPTTSRRAATTRPTARPGLPLSPLEPVPSAVGFRWG